MRQTVLTGGIDPKTPTKGSDVSASLTTPNQKFAKALAIAVSPASPSSGRPKAGDGPKYGRCPRCPVGRRVRTRFKPYGNSPNKGKFRFVCSNRADGCPYFEILEQDPAADPGLYSAQTQGQAVSINNGSGTGTGTATPGADTPKQKLGCPGCLKGRLVKKCKDTFNWKQPVLVCEKIWDGKEVVGGCGYSIDLDNDCAPTTPSAGVAGNAAKVVDSKVEETERKNKDMENWVTQEQQRARNNPQSAAVLAGLVTKFKKKNVVDLTKDASDSIKTTSSSVAAMVGAQAPILISDSDSEIAGDFDDEDEAELMRMADEAEASCALK